MGTGANCSYTNSSSGIFVPLICPSGQCCDTTRHTCSSASCQSDDDGVSLNTYLFWVILAGASLFTVLMLVVSYAICRYRKPGCADAGAARDRFLEENILAATLSRWTGSHSSNSTSQASVNSPSTSSPATGLSPSSSPDPLLLVHKPLNKAKPSKSMIPVKKPNPAAVNKAFIMGVEAFARKPITVQQSTGGASQGPTARARPLGRLRQNNDVSTSGAASPRMVQLGGFTPRVILKDKGRTESKQTIISSDSMTTVDS